MPRILLVNFTKSEAREFYASKAGASSKALRVDSITQAAHITLAAVVLKYISGKYETYSPQLVFLEIVGLFVAVSIVMLWVLKFERSLAKKRLEEEA